MTGIYTDSVDSPNAKPINKNDKVSDSHCWELNHYIIFLVVCMFNIWLGCENKITNMQILP